MGRGSWPLLPGTDAAAVQRLQAYETYATPFAFLIDERGVIVSRGIINNGQHIDFVLTGAGKAAKNGQAEPEPAEAGVV